MYKLHYLMITAALVLSTITVNAKDWEAVKARALAGDVMSQVDMGDYYDGRNCHEALKWYQMAAKQGQFDARMRIANYYALGQCPGVARDIVKGYVLYRKILGNYILYPESQKALEQHVLELERELSPEQLEKAREKINFEWEF